MHTIISSEVPVPAMPDVEESMRLVGGFVVAIEPPISLNPDVVSSAYTKFRVGAADQDRRVPSTPFNEAILIGSTEDRTVIYVGLEEKLRRTEKLIHARVDLGRITNQLLALVGITETETRTEKPTTSALV